MMNTIHELEQALRKLHEAEAECERALKQIPVVQMERAKIVEEFVYCNFHTFRELRRRAMLSQRYVAKRANTYQTIVCAFEHGRTGDASEATLLRLIQVYADLEKRYGLDRNAEIR